MPNETLDPNLTPEDVHRIHSAWQGDDYHEQLDRRDLADSSDKIDEGLYRESAKLREAREAEAPRRTIPVFEIPPQALADLNERHEEDEPRKIVETTPGFQLELPADLLPTESFASKIPVSAQPGVRNFLEEQGADWGRIQDQAQTTTNGPDARSRATIETEEDRSRREVETITRRAYRQADSAAQKHHSRIKQANIKRRYGESGPSAKALGEI